MNRADRPRVRLANPILRSLAERLGNAEEQARAQARRIAELEQPERSAVSCAAIAAAQRLERKGGSA